MLSASLAACGPCVVARPAYWYSHMVKVLAAASQWAGPFDAVAGGAKRACTSRPRFNRSYINWFLLRTGL